MAFNFIKVTLLVACFATASSVRRDHKHAIVREADLEVQEEAHEVTSDGYNSSFANGSSAIFAQAPEEFQLHFDKVPAGENLGFTLSQDNQVIEVVPNSAAEKAGVKAGDKISGFGSSSTQEIIRDDSPLFQYRLGVLGAVGGLVLVERPGTGAEVGAVATDLAAAGKPYEAESPPEQEPGQDLGYMVDAGNTVIMVRGGSQAWKQGARAGDLATKTGFQKAGPMFSGVQLPAEDLELLGLSSEELGPPQESKKTLASACRKMKFKFHPDKQRDKSSEEIEKAGQMIREVNNACEKLEGLLATADRLGTEALPVTEFEVLVEGPMGVALEDLEKLEQGKVEKTFVNTVAPDSRAEQLGIKPGDAATAFVRVASGRNYFRFFREGGFANSAH